MKGVSKAERNVLEIVWQSGPLHRYTPRSINGGAGWLTYDKREGRFIEGRELLQIDPRELLAESSLH